MNARNLTCPECGAPGNCWWRMGEVCAWEWEDPALQALHFFIVAGWNLQHPAMFTADALEALRRGFVEAVDGDLPGPAIRRRAGLAFEGARRVLRPEAERRPVFRAWGMTIAAVHDPGPAGAADRVKAWRAAIRAEL